LASAADGAAADGAAVAAAAVALGSRPLTGLAALLLGLAYGLCLVSGLRQSEELAGAHDRGAVPALYYVLACLGFASPYAADAVNGVPGDAGTLTATACVAAGLTAGLAGQAGRARRPAPVPAQADERTRVPLSLVGGRYVRQERRGLTMHFKSGFG
jgi:hypothetical protein